MLYDLAGRTEATTLNLRTSKRKRKTQGGLGK